MTEREVKDKLRNWIAEKNGKIKPEELTDQTPIMEQRLLPSIHMIELILFLEQLSGKTIDVKQLKKGVFRDVDTLYRNFFPPSKLS